MKGLGQEPDNGDGQEPLGEHQTYILDKLDEQHEALDGWVSGGRVMITRGEEGPLFLEN